MFALLFLGLIGLFVMMWLGRRGRWKSALLVSSPVLLWMAWAQIPSFFDQDMPAHLFYERNVSFALFAVLLFEMWAGYGIGFYLKLLADRKTVDRKTEATN